MIIKNVKASLLLLGFFLGFVATAQADPIVMRAYKEAFPDAWLKCSDCHLSAFPKQEKGKHDWNAYGQAVKKAINTAGVPDIPTADNIGQMVDVFKKIGKREDYKEPAPAKK